MTDILSSPSVATVSVKERSTWRPLPGRAPVVDNLPQAPSDEDKFAYFGNQHIWFITARTIAACSAATSLVLFSATTPLLWLFWPMATIFIGYMILTHIATTRRRRISRMDHERIVRLWNPETIPSIDVFLPSAGEPLDVLRNTYEHVARMSWAGRLVVRVMDDSARPEVAELAAEYGFTYDVRDNRPLLKKAGNLKYAFDRTEGDLIVIFDADFCPRADFLTELVPYFGDPTIAIVQSPQFFDADKKRQGWLEESAGSVQESFYRWAQVSRDKLGAPICVGTCAIYRRSALHDSGGFAQIGHSEDVHTGVNLMKVGYRTIYVPIVVAKGLCPDKLSSFISQQYRWCLGSMSLLADRAFHDAPLRYRQRLCFFTGFGYYISTGVGVYVLSLPTLIMLWFLPDRINISNFYWLIPTFLLYPLIALIHKTRWRPVTLRVYTISSFAHAAAIWHALRGRAADWVPTGQTRKTGMTTHVTRLMVGWTALTNAVMVAGVVNWFMDGRPIVDIFPVLLFSALNAYTWVPIAWQAWIERQPRERNGGRFPLRLRRAQA
jgi:cellulose synthase/poly-beta-1,6-N-acetylglucosamine synthase-like glycosyltransferase